MAEFLGDVKDFSVFAASIVISKPVTEFNSSAGQIFIGALSNAARSAGANAAQSKKIRPRCASAHTPKILRLGVDML